MRIPSSACRPRRALAVLAFLFLASPSREDDVRIAGGPAARAPREPSGTEADLRDRIERSVADQSALERSNSNLLSPASRERMRRFFADEQRALDAIDFDALGLGARIDFLLQQSRLRFEARELEHTERRQEEVQALLPFAGAIMQLDESRRRLDTVDAASAAGALVEIARLAEQARRTVERRLQTPTEPGPPLPGKPAAARAAGLVDDLRQVLGNWQRFYSGYDPEVTWWTKEPYARAAKSLEEYASFLRKRLAGFTDAENDPIIGDPIGRQALLDALEMEMIPYSPEELIEIARQEFAWCDAEMLRASRELGFGDDTRRALEHVKSRHMKPGEQPLLIQQLANEAIEFVVSRDLVTVPPLCREVWRMEMMSPERQRVNPFFTGGEVVSVSFPTDSMSHEEKLMSMRGNNVHFSRATVQHELIPGHHLQGFMAARHRPYRRVFRTPFLVEGWSLYWEMLLWDLGFAKTPEDRIGMLFWRSHRCARIIFSLRFHLGEMTAAEAVDFLVDRVGHERSNATGEVRRSVSGAYPPLYQAAYMLGGLQIRALWKELVGSGKMTNRDFHDAILRENAIPIEMIRASLTSQPLTRDFKARWKFYGDPLGARGDTTRKF
jgi:uncharacterized protein (DUF885 family)